MVSDSDRVASLQDGFFSPFHMLRILYNLDNNYVMEHQHETGIMCDGVNCEQSGGGNLAVRVHRDRADMKGVRIIDIL